MLTMLKHARIGLLILTGLHISVDQFNVIDLHITLIDGSHDGSWGDLYHEHGNNIKQIDTRIERIKRRKYLKVLHLKIIGIRSKRVVVIAWLLTGEELLTKNAVQWY